MKSVQWMDVLQILATIVGLGLAYMIALGCFVRDATQRVNDCCGEEMYRPAMQMLLCLAAPFYIVYWAWRQADRLDALTRTRAPQLSDLAVPCLLLAAVCPYLAIIALENRMNTWEKLRLSPGKQS